MALKRDINLEAWRNVAFVLQNIWDWKTLRKKWFRRFFDWFPWALIKLQGNSSDLYIEVERCFCCACVSPWNVLLPSPRLHFNDCFFIFSAIVNNCEWCWCGAFSRTSSESACGKDRRRGRQHESCSSTPSSLRSMHYKCLQPTWSSRVPVSTSIVAGLL